MTARTHDLGALTAYAGVIMASPVRSITLATALVSLLANQLGGIAPDIDQPTAPFWKNLPVGKYFGKVIDKMLGGHRFITHSLLGLLIFGLGMRWLLNLVQPIMHQVDVSIVWWAFIIGMISHIVMDMFTKEGVPLLLPLPIKIGIPPIKAFRITTGKFAEKIIFVLILCFDIWYSTHHYSHLKTILHNIN